MRKITLFTTLALAGLVAGCTEFTEPDHTLKTNSANFTKYMAVGNSITAGYQSNSLFEAAQLKAYPNLIAGQVKTTFAIPTISGDGIGGRIKWNGSFTSAGSPAFTFAAAQGGAPTNTGYYATGNYNNLGIPGMRLVLKNSADTTDFFHANVTGSTNPTLSPTAYGIPRYLLARESPAGANPYFNIVLANGARGSSVWLALKASQPTFVTVWLGNNDVLGYATSGGTSPSAPTDVTEFEKAYTSVLDSILGLSSAPNMAVATIPNVVTIPFFTTVNPSLASMVPSGVSLRFQKTNESTAVGTGTATAAELLSYKHMVTMLASSYLLKLNQPYGGWIKRLADSQGRTVDQVYTDLQQAGIDTTKGFGFDPRNPLPNYLILDEEEVVKSATAVAMFNAKIKSIASQPSRTGRVVVIDVSAEFDRIAAATKSMTTVSYQGVPVDSRFILGGLFSYDGVHPSDLGHGLIANLFIQGINKKFGANIQEISLRSLDGVRFGKLSSKTQLDVIMPEGSLDNMLRAVGAF